MIFRKALLKGGYWLGSLISIFVYRDQIEENTPFFVVNFLMLGCFLLIQDGLTDRKARKKVTFLFLIFFNLTTYIQLSHYILFKDQIRASTLFIIFDSNALEIKDFLSFYFDLKLLWILVMISSAVLYSMLKDSEFLLSGRSTGFKTIRWVSLVVVLLVLFKLRIFSFPHIVYSAVKEYKVTRELFLAATEDKFGGKFTNVSHESVSEIETYVLVIGESTTRHHMGLYEYQRRTNPLLNKLKDELIIYNDVISPHTHTITSLGKSLTLSSYENPNAKYDGSLIQMFNRAGFETYWISNQNPVGIYETNTTLLASNCKKQVYLNTSNEASSSISYDEKVLEPFENALKQDFEKKLIVIHLMGAHLNYGKRYPKEFEYFGNDPKTIFNHKKAFETINQYDNAVLYNDFIVSQIIEATSALEIKSTVLYFSDHGEDVYETINTSCHTETKGTKPMYDIPFILWRSKTYILEEQNKVFDENRKYILEDLIYTVADLANIHFDEFDKARSVINDKFVPKKRMIKKDSDYDEVFNVK
jgi:heptose-I-phosphate ethanolaminephosphotransferase